LPFIPTSVYNRFKEAASKYSDLQDDYNALKKSSVSLTSYAEAKKKLADAKDNNKILTNKLNSISKLYSGVKGKYDKLLIAIEEQNQKLNQTIQHLDKAQEAFASKNKQYVDLVQSNATSIATMSKMKIEHGSAIKALELALEAAKKEANVAQQEIQVLTQKIAEIEKNESMAREASLTQALVNTRDFVFDNTIAGVNVSENQSRGLAILAGAAVAAYMMTRVS